MTAMPISGCTHFYSMLPVIMISVCCLQELSTSCPANEADSSDAAKKLIVNVRHSFAFCRCHLRCSFPYLTDLVWLLQTVWYRRLFWLNHTTVLWLCCLSDVKDIRPAKKPYSNNLQSFLRETFTRPSLWLSLVVCFSGFCLLVVSGLVVSTSVSNDWNDLSMKWHSTLMRMLKHNHW